MFPVRFFSLGRSSLVLVLAVAAGLLFAAQPVSAQGGAAAQSTPSPQLELDEMVRKAEAREKEDGFCRNLAWPPGPTRQQFTQWLQAAKQGTWKVNLFANGNCQYDRVTRIHQENGGKCVTYTYYACDKGGSCGIGQAIDCLNSKGVFVKRK